MVFIDFWDLGKIPDRDGFRKILTFMDCMIVFGIGSVIGMKEITSYQAARWDFGGFFVPFRLPKITVVGADGIFSGMSKKTFQETLLIPVHAVAR